MLLEPSNARSTNEREERQEALLQILATGFVTMSDGTSIVSGVQ